MPCIQIKNGVVCVPTRHRVTVDEKVYYFDFHRYSGPLLTTKQGEPYKRQPGEKHPFWKGFYRWHKRYGRKL